MLLSLKPETPILPHNTTFSLLNDKRRPHLCGCQRLLLRPDALPGSKKHVLGLWQGATENAEVCKGLLHDLVERGLRKGPEAVVLKRGSRGALLVTADRQDSFAACKVETVDTTAAGDAFSAALSVAIVSGKPLKEAVPFANAAGALAVTKLGAQPSLPTREALEEILSRNKP